MIYSPVSIYAEQDHRTGARSPEYALLGLLYEQSSHGYTLHQSLVSELGHCLAYQPEPDLQHIKRLEIQGFISATIVEQEKTPPRQLLHLTPAGRRRFEDWLQTPSGSSVLPSGWNSSPVLYFAQKYFPNLIQPYLDDQTSEIKTALPGLKPA